MSRCIRSILLILIIWKRLLTIYAVSFHLFQNWTMSRSAVFTAKDWLTDSQVLILFDTFVHEFWTFMHWWNTNIPKRHFNICGHGKISLILQHKKDYENINVNFKSVNNLCLLNCIFQQTLYNSLYTLFWIVALQGILFVSCML